jgi:putative RecB family exonuclease
MAPAPTLSYSGFRAYTECPLRWKFLYVDHLPETPRGYFSFGRSIHAALEQFSAPLIVGGSRAKLGPSQRTLLDFTGPSERGELPLPMTLEQLLEVYRQTWVSEGYLSSEDERRYFDLGSDLLKRFYPLFLSAPPRILAVEQHLEAEVDGIPIHGFVDRIDETPKGGLEVLDYKTSKELSWRDARESDQLTLYQILVERNEGRDVEALTLYHMRTLSPLRTPRREAGELGDLSSRLGEVADGIRSENYEPRPGSYCARCDFRSRCPEWREVPAEERDQVQTMVDRYAELQKKEEGVRQEMEAVAAELHAASERLGVHRLPGRRVVAYRRKETRWVFPPEQVLPVLQGAGLLPRAARLDPGQVARMLEDPKVPLEVRRSLKERGSRQTEWAIRLERNGRES